MRESTLLLVTATAAGLPILLVDRLQVALGETLYFGLAAVMCIFFLVGLVMWARESKEDRPVGP